MTTKISAGVSDHSCFVTMIPTDYKITNFSLIILISTKSPTHQLHNKWSLACYLSLEATPTINDFALPQSIVMY